MMALAIALLVIAFVVCNNPVVSAVVVTSAVVFLSIVIVGICRSGSTSSYQKRGRSKKRYAKRSRRPKVKGLLSLADDMEKSRKRRSRNSGVRSSLIGLHRR